MNGKFKRIWTILICLALVFGLYSCSADNIISLIENDAASLSMSDFSVRFIDIGQGDAALVRCDGETMLIDGGKNKMSDIIYTCLKTNGIDTIDYMVCTHADDDHIGGLSAAFSAAEVKNVLSPAIGANTKSYKNLMSKINENNVPVQNPKPGEKIMLGKSIVEFYGPISETADDRNNGSIVMKIIYGKTSFLFTGDAERKEEQEMIDAGFDLSATVLKVGHHGSRNSTTYPFLREVMPEYAVISVGKGNSYGHPTADVLSRLRDADVKVYRTDMQGDILMTSDGHKVSVSVQKNADANTNPTER